MKEICLSLLILCLSSVAEAQSNSILDVLNAKNVPVSKTEKRLADIEQKIFFEILTVENMADGKTLRGLIISVNRNQQAISNILDSSEVVVFKNALSRLKSKLLDNDFRKTEFKLGSGSGLLFSSKYSNNSSLWLHRIEIKKSHLDPTFYFGNDGLDSLIKIFESALKEIRQIN